MPGGRRLDQRSDGDRAGKRQMAHAGMGGERRARLFAEARHDIEGAVRKAGLAGEIGKRERSEAGLLGRLQHAGVAHRQRRADRAAGDLHRIVPRHDMAGHPMRLAQGIDGVAVEIGNGLAHQLVGRAGVKFHVARHRQGVRAALPQRLADVERLDFGELLDPARDAFAEPHHQPPALGRGEPPPVAGKRPLGRRDRGVDVRSPSRGRSNRSRRRATGPRAGSVSLGARRDPSAADKAAVDRIPGEV